MRVCRPTGIAIRERSSPAPSDAPGAARSTGNPEDVGFIVSRANASLQAVWCLWQGLQSKSISSSAVRRAWRKTDRRVFGFKLPV